MDHNIQPSVLGYEYFKQVVKSMPMIFYLLDEKGIFKLSDGHGLEKLGLKPGQVVGLSAFDVYKDIPDIVDALKSAYLGNTVQKIHTLGDYVLENHVAPYYDDEGNLLGIVGATIDISARKEMENELKQVRSMTDAILDSVPGMLYLYDDQGKLVFWNKNHITMTGYTADELRGRSLADWYVNDPESINNVTKGLEVTSTGGVGTAEANLQCKDGTKIPMYFTAKAIELSGKSYFVGIGIDITDKKRAEQQLLELNETLEIKVEERTNELTEANEELTGANEELYAMNEEIHAMNEELMDTNERMREMQGFLVESEKMAALGNMVAGISHEINTPVGVGVTAASSLVDLTQELLKLKEEGNLTDQLLESYLEDIESTSNIILKNLNRASRLVHSFKQLSVDQSVEPRRTFKVKEYLDEILISLSPSLKKTRIKVDYQCEDNLEIDGYPGAFAQIITNLVLNSLYHGYAPNMEGQIQMHFSLQKKNVILEYKDDGFGMTPEVQSKIFDPFYTTKRGSGGSGLGLFVIYGIITNQYKGSIRCESAPNEGTRFHISLAQGGQ